MKTSKVLRDIHEASYPFYLELEERVTEILKERVKRERWFFLSRVKEPESFAQKIETCKVDNPSKLDDFFACTIVVPTADDFDAAKHMIEEKFEIDDREKELTTRTNKSAHDFYFDDIKLYVYQRPDENGPPNKFDMVTFEVQIKTIFQQAWTDATHQFVYKSGSVSWARERIAYQIRAILEQADIMLMLSKTSGINKFPALAKRHKKTTMIEVLIHQISDIWDETQLPVDKKRLANNIYELMTRIGCQDEFRDIVNGEISRLGGSLPVNLSPYSFVVQALLNSSKGNLKRYFKNKQCFRKKGCENIICIHADMDVPDWVNNLKCGVQNLDLIS